MDWEISIDQESNVLYVKTLGLFNMDSTAELIKECLALIKMRGCRRCLVDNTGLQLIRIETLEIYSAPAMFSSLGVPRSLHIAQVFSEKHKNELHFLEKVCYNNGYSVSVFSEIELARQWLNK